MIRWLLLMTRPKIREIVEDDAYQAERDVIDQSARYEQLQSSADEAKAILRGKIRRLKRLRAELATYDAGVLASHQGQMASKGTKP